MWMNNYVGKGGLQIAAELKLIVLIIIVLTVGLTPSWLQYDGFMLTSDFLNQQIPFIIETKRMFASGTPFWSWNTYFGDNFLAAYSFYTVTSPFVWINCLFPVELVYRSLTFTLYLKFIVLGLVSFKFFEKVGVSVHNAILGSLLFVFSSFVIITSGYYHFFEPIICFPLLLFAVEKFCRDEHYAGTCLSMTSFLVVFVNFYFAPCTFIPALIYFIFRAIETRRISTAFVLKAVGYVTLGFFCSSVILFPTLFHMAGGPRMGIAIWDGYNFEDRLFSLFSPKLKEGAVPLVGHTGWTSTAVCIPVVGCMLAAIYVKRQFKSALSLTIVILLCLYLTPLNAVFSLFTDPSYTRWAYALTFFIVFASVRLLDSDSRQTIREYGIYSIICLCLCAIRYAIPVLWRLKKGIPFVEDEIVYTTIQLSLIIGGLILLYLFVTRNAQKTRVILVSLFSIVHLACFLFSRSDAYDKLFVGDTVKVGMFDKYVKDNGLSYHQKSNAYRTDFVTRLQPYYMNLALLENIPSVQTYNSVRNNNIVGLFLVSDSTDNMKQNSFQSNINLTSFDALMSVKYVVHYKDSMSQMGIPDNLRLLHQNEYYKLYESDNFIPFGFTYDKYILQEELDTLLFLGKKPDISLFMLNTLAVMKDDESDFSSCMSRGSIEDSVCLAQVVVDRRKNVCSDHVFTTRGFTCKLNVDGIRSVFFSVPADKGFTAYIDERPTKIYKVNCGLSAIIVPAGNHMIRFDFIPNGILLGAIVSILSLICIVICHIRERKNILSYR